MREVKRRTGSQVHGNTRGVQGVPQTKVGGIFSRVTDATYRDGTSRVRPYGALHTGGGARHGLQPRRPAVAVGAARARPQPCYFKGHPPRVTSGNLEGATGLPTLRLTGTCAYLSSAHSRHSQPNFVRSFLHRRRHCAPSSSPAAALFMRLGRSASSSI